MNILAVESSCDETAVAVVRDGRQILTDCIASQVDLHRLYGGVVPEIASRKHIEAIYGLADQALERSGLTRQQITRLPQSILGIERTASARELARYYAMADYFVNLTYQDTYPTTNLEAISCGTPVITYQTGGSPESALLYGTAVPRGDVAAVARLLGTHPVFTPAPDLSLDRSAALEQYLRLYLPEAPRL